MSDLLDKASAWLTAQRRRFASRLVVYRRGELSVSVLAQLGRSVFEVDDGAGAVIRSESRDFLIEVADLPVVPQRGDQIVDGDFTYEVLSPNGQPPWTYSDDYRRLYRIHTQQVSAP